MKKILFFLILGVSLGSAAPLHAMLIPMTEAQMRAAFGQAGISIDIEYVLFEQYAGEISYTDTDGTDGRPCTAFIRDQHVIREAKSIYTEEEFKDKFVTASITTENPSGIDPIGTWTKASPITIDTGACNTLTAIRDSNEGGPSGSGEKIVGIVVGVPTLMVKTNTLEFNVGVSMEGALNNNQIFLQFETKGSTVFYLGGTVEVAAR